MPGAIQALHEMKAAGYNVMLLLDDVDFDLMRDISQWIKSKVGADWVTRIVIVP